MKLTATMWYKSARLRKMTASLDVARPESFCLRRWDE